MSDVDEVRRGRGRPVPKGRGNTERLEVRISREERDALDHMLIESDKNKSELVRKAIMLYYKTNRGRW